MGRKDTGIIVFNVSLSLWDNGTAYRMTLSSCIPIGSPMTCQGVYMEWCHILLLIKCMVDLLGPINMSVPNFPWVSLCCCHRVLAQFPVMCKFALKEKPLEKT